jgi:hypothetical protein
MKMNRFNGVNDFRPLPPNEGRLKLTNSAFSVPHLGTNYPSSKMAPNKTTIAEIFAHLAEGDQKGFFSNVDPNVGKYSSNNIISAQTLYS